MCARKRLLLEQLESRDLFAVAEFTTQLYADEGGAPGAELAAQEVGVGDSFFVEILAREFDPAAGGLRGIALDLEWNPAELAVLDENVVDTVTDNLPAFRRGTLDAEAGTITNLSGNAIVSASAGRPIGNLRPERFALLHFVALAPADAATIAMEQGGLGITTSPVMSLKTRDLSFVSPSITIVDAGGTAPEVGATEITDEVVDNSAWELDIPFEENVVSEDPSGEPFAGDEIFYTLGLPESDDPRVQVFESLENAVDDAAHEVTDRVLAVTTSAKNVIEKAAKKVKVAVSPLAQYRANLREVRRAAKPIRDWSKIQVVMVGVIATDELPRVKTAARRVSAPVPEAQWATATPAATSPVVTAPAKVAAPKVSATAAVPASKPAANKAADVQRTVAETAAKVTSPSFFDSIADRWKHLRKKVFSFDWSLWGVMLIVLSSASASFAQEQSYYNPLEAFSKYQARRVERPMVSRPLPPIRRSVATATEEDILAVAAEEEIVAERPVARRAAVDPRSSVPRGARRAHYQEEIYGGPNVELPAEMQTGEYVFDDGGGYMPPSGRGGGFMSGLFGSRGGGGFDNCQNCGPLWVRGEYLLWWMDGFDVPPLVTSAPAGTNLNVAGILGQNATTILYGNEGLEDGSRSGGRFTAGWWLDPQDTIGIQATYFLLDSSSSNFAASSPGTAIIARPFFNVEPGFEGPDAELVAFPGLFLGTITVDSSTSLQGLDALLRGNIATQGCWRVDGLVGYRYQRLKDTLTINDNRTVIGTNTGLAVGTTFSEFDQFNTSNEFHGGEVGMVAMYRGRGGLSLEGILKLAVGNNRQSVLISGQSSSSVPVVGGAPQVATTNAGLLAQSTNIGVYKADQFAVIPEVGLNIGYYFTPCLRGTVGYTFMYWTDVVRPGGQIDPNLNLSQLAVGGLNGIPRPEFTGVTDNLWIHGLSVGLDWQF